MTGQQDDSTIGWQDNRMTGSFAEDWPYGIFYLVSRYAIGNWLGEGDSFTIVDTPGFGDSDNDDNLLIDEVYWNEYIYFTFIQ